MLQAEKALQQPDFTLAKALYTHLHEKMPNDVYVVQKLILATYKAKLPSEKEALEEALKLLQGLNPRESTDTETLRLSQAVHKILWNLTQDRSYLEEAIWASEKGFYLKDDHYNGINLAYLYNVRASISEGLDVVTDFVLAQRTRSRVIQLCQGLLDQTRTPTSGKWFDRDAKYSLLEILAQAWMGLGNEAECQNCLDELFALDPPPPAWSKESTEECLHRLRTLLAHLQLKIGLTPTQPAASKSQ